MKVIAVNFHIIFVFTLYFLNITIPQRKNNIDGIDKVYCLPLKGRPKIPSFKALIYIFFIIAERCFPPLTVSGKNRTVCNAYTDGAVF